MPQSSRLSIDNLTPPDFIDLDNIESTEIVGGIGSTVIFYDAPVIPKFIVNPNRPNVATLDLVDLRNQLLHPPTQFPHIQFTISVS